MELSPKEGPFLEEIEELSLRYVGVQYLMVQGVQLYCRGCRMLTEDILLGCDVCLVYSCDYLCFELLSFMLSPVCWLLAA